MTTGSYTGDAIIVLFWLLGFVAVLAGLDLCATIYERARRCMAMSARGTLRRADGGCPGHVEEAKP